MSAVAVLIVAMTAVAIPVYLTGEQNKEQVEHLPGISESITEEHEDAAKTVSLAGIASLAALVLQFSSSSKIPYVAATALAILGVSNCSLSGDGANHV